MINMHFAQLKNHDLKLYIHQKYVDIYVVFLFHKIFYMYIHLCNISENGSKCNIVLTFYEKPEA